MRRVLEGLGVGDGLEFFELNPDGYDHVIADEERFDIPGRKQAFIDRLVKTFPHEQRGIEAYFRFMTRMDREFQRLNSLPGFLAPLLLPFVAPRLTFRGLRPLSHEYQGKITLLPPSTTTPVLPAKAGEHEMSHV